jgi:hypothetical protein
MDSTEYAEGRQRELRICMKNYSNETETGDALAKEGIENKQWHMGENNAEVIGMNDYAQNDSGASQSYGQIYGSIDSTETDL